MAEIALQAIDQVTVAMDFDRGADHQEVVNRCCRSWPLRRPRRVAQSLPGGALGLDNLINVGSTDRGFRALYGTFGPSGRTSGGCGTSGFSSSLSPQTGRLPAASDEAINVLVGALDTDVESAQIAAEVKLENLIRRGRLSDPAGRPAGPLPNSPVRGDAAAQVGGDPPGCPGGRLGA